MEEEQFPSINNICDAIVKGEPALFSPGDFCKQDFVDSESQLCADLSFHLQQIVPHHFVDRYLHASMAGDGRRWPSFPQDTLKCLVMYYLDLSLHELTFHTTPRRQITAAAVLLARLVLAYSSPDGKLWSDTLTFYTKYEVNELSKCDLVPFIFSRIILLRNDLNFAEVSTMKLQNLHYRASTEFINTFRKFSSVVNNAVALLPAPLQEDLESHFK